jgi:hypothetical protein
MMKSFALWRVLAFGLMLVMIGYLSGRSHVIGKIRSLYSTANSGPATEAVAGPPQDVAASPTYVQLHALLDARLELQRRQASDWRRLLDATEDLERIQIADELRSKFIALLRPWPGPRTDADPEEEPWFEQDGVDVSLVHLETHPGVRMTCALLTPQDANRQTPALLALHGFGGSLQSVVADIDYHHGFGMALAQNGFIVLAPLSVTTTIATRSPLQIKALASGWTLRALDTWQLVRAVDYLTAIENVDQAHIGVYGISRGGQNALQIGALDQRLSLVITSGYFTDRFSWSFTMGPLQLAHHIDIAPNMAFLFDDLNLIALIQPRFLGVETGVRDGRHESAVIEFEKVAGLYQHIGHPERAALIAIDGGHETSVETVMPFLRSWVQTPALERGDGR